MLLLTGINVLIGTAWYLCLIVAVTGAIIVLGHGRIFRAGVTRSVDKIVCHYIPWYEGNAYGTIVLIPLMGVAFIAAGRAPGNPAWLLPVGIMLVGVMPLVVFFIARMWRRCLLRITPSALTMQLDARGSKMTEIGRERVDSIEPKTALIGTLESLQVAITYMEPGTESTKTVLLGPPPGPEALQVSVQRTNLLNALVAWKDGANDDPSQLLDRIERALRGR